MSTDQSTLTADGYTRLSQDSDRSIPRQKEKIKEWVENHPDTALNKIFDDGRWSTGFSTEDRDEWQRVLKRIQNGENDMVVADGKRRFARDFDDTMELIVACRRNNVQLVDTKEGPLDLNDPMNVAIELVQAASEHEAMQRYIEKSIKESTQRMESGYYHGEPPVGLTFDEDKQYLIADEDEFDEVLSVLELREQGLAFRRIADEVSWSHPTVSKIVKRREQYEAVANGAKLGHQLQIVEPVEAE